jgi:Meckel syndrome type 1 protein
MKQDLNQIRRAAALLMAAAALPHTPLAAQDTQAPTQPPAAQPAPPPAPAPVDVQAPPAPAPVPTVNVAPPAPAPAAAAPVAARAAPSARVAARSPVRAPASFATATRAARAARAASTAAATRATATPTPAPASAASSSAPATTSTAPAVTPAPPPTALPAAPAPTPAQPAARRSIRSILPWLVIALVVLGIAAFAFARRRRNDEYYEETYDEPAVEPVAAAAPVAAPVAAVAEGGLRRPWLDLALEPVRAGVEGDEAVVEFALKVDNRGGAPARDVRVSAFMLQAGATEAERALIAPDAAHVAPPVTIAAGESKQVETAVALPTGEVKGDAVLPVVVADARYTLPDGSEGHTSASFAVGVPDGEELAHFAVDNPSGLHDDVVARPLGEMEKA